MRCRAKTIDGNRCKNTAVSGGAACRTHSQQYKRDKIAKSGVVGALTYIAAANPIAGLIGGAAAYLLQEDTAQKAKVFVSFDFHNDRRLKTLLVNQANDKRSTFDIVDHSLLEAAPEPEWRDYAKKAIDKSDIVVVILGERTYEAPGVLIEIAIAKNLGKKVIQLKGYRKRHCPSIGKAGRVYRWTWENLNKQLN